MKRFAVSLLVLLSALRVVESTVAEATSVAFFTFLFLTFVHRIGKRIALLESISLIAALELLLVPAVTYWVFPASMPIESRSYFTFALPATLAFCGGISGFGRSSLTRPHQTYIQAASAYLQDKQMASLGLLVVGLSGFLMKRNLPNAPYILSVLPSYCLFVSVLYAYYSRSKYRIFIIILTSVLLLTDAVQTGMFGELFFWLMLMTIVVTTSASSPITTQLKAFFVTLAFAMLLLIQSIKGEYRWHTWGHYRNERTGDAALMINLLVDRMANPEKILTIDHIYLSFVRFNQGIMVGSAMTKVPEHEAYAKGEVMYSLLCPFVPRLVWPNKPQTGGYENIRRFTTLPQFENTSINLSPIGEGYVNFGYGGILFALLYGMLLRGVFQSVFYLAEYVPTSILWLPMLYIGSLTMETDLLSTWGSLVNSALFISVLFWLLKHIGIPL